MASIQQMRAAILEEIVLYLLIRSGYRRVQVGEEGTDTGSAGLIVEGRGAWHQIDALVTPLYAQAFIYPIRLLVEAKCQLAPVGLLTVRSVVGVLFDISQNYFSEGLPNGGDVLVRRFNYHAAMFATSGYSEDAEKFALAHQVFLIDYSDVPSIRPVIDALLALSVSDFSNRVKRRKPGNIAKIREGFRTILETQEVGGDQLILSKSGVAKVRERLLPAITEIHGSYYGMIEGVYPVHLVSRRPIPNHLIREKQVIPCAIHFTDNESTWAFEPTEIPEGSPDFFLLEFSIPEFIANMLKERTESNRPQQPRWLYIANLKQEYLKYIDINTLIDGKLMSFRLVLDVNWLSEYIGRRKLTAVRKRQPV